MDQVKVGYLLGTGAAANVSLGWIPDTVEVVNVTDGDKITKWFRGKWIAFTSGGTVEVLAGDTIVGATSGAEAYVQDVLLASGTWAGGDAAGFFLVHEDDLEGAFGSENVNVGANANVATVTAAQEHTVSIDTEVATETGNAAISAYLGDESNSPGFTIGSTVSEDNKLLRYVATRNG